ncbi:hypothetical protein D3C81_1528920 [compost metagenome]
MQVKIEIAVQRVLFAGEAVHHGGRQAVAELAQDRQQPLAGLALVEKHRAAQLAGQRQLLLQRALLLRPGREVAVEIQAAFAHRADLRLSQQGAQLAGAVGAPRAGFVRVQTGGGEQTAAFGVELPAQLQRCLAVIRRGAGEYQLAHTGVVGALQNCFALLGK